MTMTAESPILLMQWLSNPDDGQEAETAFAEFRSRFDIAYIDVGAVNGGKEMIYDSLISWATNNPYCQSIYIGCHGFEDRLGPTGSFPNNEVGITYRDLWLRLQEAHKLHRRALLKNAIERCELFEGQRLTANEGRFDLWLGACRSASAVNCWSPLDAQTRPRPVGAVIGFEDKPNPNAVATFLSVLMEQQELASSTWSENTWKLLMDHLPNNMPAVYHLNYMAKPAKWERPHDFQ